MLDATEKFKMKGYFVTINIEKAFGSLDHSFLLKTVENFGFGTDFLDWMKMFINKSCVINGGVITQYFKPEKGAPPGDPISPYLFIFCLKILFTIVKKNTVIKSSNILGNTLLYATYVDDRNFFLKNLGSIKKLLNTISLFRLFSI